MNDFLRNGTLGSSHQVLVIIAAIANVRRPRSWQRADMRMISRAHLQLVYQPHRSAGLASGCFSSLLRPAVPSIYVSVLSKSTSFLTAHCGVRDRQHAGAYSLIS